MTVEELFLEVRDWTYGPYFVVESEVDLEVYADGPWLCHRPTGRGARHTVVVDGRRFAGDWERC